MLQIKHSNNSGELQVLTFRVDLSKTHPPLSFYRADLNTGCDRLPPNAEPEHVVRYSWETFSVRVEPSDRLCMAVVSGVGPPSRGMAKGAMIRVFLETVARSTPIAVTEPPQDQ